MTSSTPPLPINQPIKILNWFNSLSQNEKIEIATKAYLHDQVKDILNDIQEIRDIQEIDTDTDTDTDTELSPINQESFLKDTLSNYSDCYFDHRESVAYFTNSNFNGIVCYNNENRSNETVQKMFKNDIHFCIFIKNVNKFEYIPIENRSIILVELTMSSIVSINLIIKIVCDVLKHELSRIDNSVKLDNFTKTYSQFTKLKELLHETNNITEEIVNILSGYDIIEPLNTQIEYESPQNTIYDQIKNTESESKSEIEILEETIKIKKSEGKSTKTLDKKLQKLKNEQ